jgi:ABC-type multidrug transport system ATPase subunit/pSer/pThr/pTyr-binding forkhead associated (FHA) protein
MKKESLKLFFYKDSQLFKKVVIKEDLSLMLGSSSNCDLIISNKRISRNHCQIIYSNSGELKLIDLNSTNGTFLNGIKLKSEKTYNLNIKDQVQLAGLSGILMSVGSENTQSRDLDSQKNILELFKNKNSITIGRDSLSDLRINDTRVSRKHASIKKLSNDKFLIKDLGSLNGVYVNGSKVNGSKVISKIDNIFIGKYLIKIDGRAKDLSDELAISAIGIEKIYPNQKNGKKALHKMDLSVPSKSLLAIMGPSGCGKSTLLKSLNGESPPTKGNVLIFNQDLITNYEYLKTQIGYVPQDDIVHNQLTVEQSLFFAAKLRIANISKSDIELKINKILSELNISHIKKNLISDISGGQRKRVSIAIELLTDPMLLFLDEPTSPLDPQTIEDFLNILKSLSKNGTTVIMVTHKPEDLDYMDEVIFMADNNGGKIVYYGDSTKYKEYFNVKNAVSVFSQISGPDSKIWVNKYANPRPVSKTQDNNKILTNKSNQNPFEQFFWLTMRYFRIKTNDKVNTSIMLLQAPIIALLICLVFKELQLSVLFIMAVSAVWFGSTNAAREIVGELAVYKRERMYNLKLMPYIFSKITVLSVFSIIQSLIFIFILYINYNNSSYDISLNNPFVAFLWMSFLTISSTFLGLLLSAIFDTSEKVLAVVPIILIPQIMLAGLVAKIGSSTVELVSYLTFTRWGIEGFGNIQRDILHEGYVNKAIEILKISFHNSYQENFNSSGSLTLDFIAIMTLVIIMFILIYFILKRKDSI